MRLGSVRLAAQEGSSCMPSNGPPEPIIETPTHEPSREETGDRALRLRVRQQEILAELGVTALKGTPFDDLLKEAVLLCAQGLEAEFCKVLEYVPAQNRLLMRAGVGWDEGLVGKIGRASCRERRE